MAHIAIPIPPGRGKQEIEIQMIINGEKQNLEYRVELFYWTDCKLPIVNRVECLREILSDYDQDWQLYFIGEPTQDFVPITFVKKETREKQREMLLSDV